MSENAINPYPYKSGPPTALPGHDLTTLLSEEEIQNRIKELGAEISKEMSDKDPILVCVLKGAYVFLADLVRQIDFPVAIEFIRVSSYGNNLVTSGEVKMELDLACSISGRHVILVEDIVDTGLTLDYLKANMGARGPASVKICSLLHKPSNNVKLAHIDYVGFNIPNDFVVGYGLDYHGYYRSLPYIATVQEKK